MARPEGVLLMPAGKGRVTGRVVERRFTGSTAYYTVLLSDGGTIEVEDRPEAAEADMVVGLDPAARGLHLFAIES